MAEHARPKKQLGRPPVAPEKAKRHSLGIRTTKELKELLRKAADSAGRSVAAEIEIRLERSAWETPVGPRTAALLRRLGDWVDILGYEGDEWLNDRGAFNTVVDRWNRHLKEIRPKANDEFQAALKQSLQVLSLCKARLADPAYLAANPQYVAMLRRQAPAEASLERLDPEIREKWAEFSRSLEEGGQPS